MLVAQAFQDGRSGGDSTAREDTQWQNGGKKKRSPQIRRLVRTRIRLALRLSHPLPAHPLKLKIRLLLCL